MLSPELRDKEGKRKNILYKNNFKEKRYKDNEKTSREAVSIFARRFWNVSSVGPCSGGWKLSHARENDEVLKSGRTSRNRKSYNAWDRWRADVKKKLEINTVECKQNGSLNMAEKKYNIKWETKKNKLTEVPKENTSLDSTVESAFVELWLVRKLPISQIPGDSGPRRDLVSRWSKPISRWLRLLFFLLSSLFRSFLWLLIFFFFKGVIKYNQMC